MQFFFQFYLSPHLTVPGKVGVWGERRNGKNLWQMKQRLPPLINQWHSVMNEKTKEFCQCEFLSFELHFKWFAACVRRGASSILTKMLIIKEPSSMLCCCRKLKCITEQLWVKKLRTRRHDIRLTASRVTMNVLKVSPSHSPRLSNKNQPTFPSTEGFIEQQLLHRDIFCFTFHRQEAINCEEVKRH